LKKFQIQILHHIRLSTEIEAEDQWLKPFLMILSLPKIMHQVSYP